MKKILSLLIIFILCITLLCSCAPKEQPPLTVDLLKIGQADAFLLKTPNHAILIDTGEEEDGAEICEKLSLMGIDTLDLLIITHYDKDHIGGAPEVLKKVKVLQMVEAGYEKDGKRYEAFRTAAKDISTTVPTETVTYEFDGVTFTIHPPTREYADENDASLVTMVTCSGKKLLFTGDILAERINDLLEAGTDLDADILKIPHHGKLEANSGDLLKAVTPTCCIITCSDKNPADPALLTLTAPYGGNTLETRDGDIRITVSAEGELTVAQ